MIDEGMVTTGDDPSCSGSMVTLADAREIILRHGYNTNAYVTLLPPSFSFFCTPGIDGVIPYQRYGHVWLCGGDPSCAPADIVPLTAAFRHAAQRERMMIAFLPATPRAIGCATARQSIRAPGGARPRTQDSADPHPPRAWPAST